MITPLLNLNPKRRWLLILHTISNKIISDHVWQIKNPADSHNTFDQLLKRLFRLTSLNHFNYWTRTRHILGQNYYIPIIEHKYDEYWDRVIKLISLNRCQLLNIIGSPIPNRVHRLSGMSYNSARTFLGDQVRSFPCQSLSAFVEFCSSWICQFCLHLFL